MLRTTRMLCATLALAAALLAGCERDPLAGAPAPQRLIVIGLDGLEWSLLVEMLEEDRMPNLARLMQAGTFGKIETIKPTSSPIIWTSIATGKRGEDHGIVDFAWKDEDGAEHLFTNADRKVKALWNILSDYNLRVATVGWWMTYPVEAVNGVMVAQANTQDDQRRLFKGSLIADVPDQVYPKEREAAVFAAIERVEKSLSRRVRRIFGVPAEGRNPKERVAIRKIEWSMQADAVYREVALDILDDRPACDLTLVYFGGTDVVGHRFWKYMRPRLYEQRPSTRYLALFRNVIPRYYEYADEVVGELLEAAGTDTNVIVLSDHGMVPVFGDTRFSAHHHEAPPGVFICAGPAFRAPDEAPDLTQLDPETVPQICSVYDIAPTILAHFRIPIGRDMVGQVLADLYRPEYQIALQPEPIATHDTPEFLAAQRQLGGRNISTEDRERLEQLRSLGYLGGDEEEEGEDDEMPLEDEPGDAEPETDVPD